MLETLFVDGRIVDGILFLMLGEAVVLAIVHRRGGVGVPLGRLLPNLLAGAFLLLALRAALAGAGTLQVAFWLALGLCGHLADLATRWSKPSPGR